MPLPSEAVVNSVLRHVGTSAATAVSIFVTLGYISPENAQEVLAATHQVMDGLQQVFGGLSKIAIILGPAAAAVTTWLAGRSSTVRATLARVAQLDAKNEIKIQGTIVAPPEVANAVPSDKVISKI